MNLFLLCYQRLRRDFFKIASVLLISLVVISCSSITQSAGGSTIDPKLKEQVLQIIRENPQVILESVQAYEKSQQNRLQEARKSFLDSLKKNPQGIVGNSPITGNSIKSVVLVEFSDFECPFCSQAHTTVKQFINKHGNQVTLVYKHLPLVQIHAQALPAAKASWAAQQQGKFWEYHNGLFEQQSTLGEELYITLAKQLNLNLEKFNQDRNSQAAMTAIEKDINLAQTLGIQGTPFFIMNGKTFSGAVSLEEMEKVLEQVNSGS